MKTFSEQLKALRVAKSLSQEELAQKLFISRQSISKWENGDATPDMENLITLATCLEVSLDELVLAKTPEVRIERVFEKKKVDIKELIRLYWIIVANVLATLLIIFLIYCFLNLIGVWGTTSLN
ncbi:helix-turn-helix domain-containing protein [Streptococcus himalayensis]|uniref:Transcriptional regulator n=1 Tax=Streptococcus himalayensis TaxID=1888195 RepID=A0A917A539_9STRE|nr:helix-turn-helix transcriptional regulator [Streptococcus himalayensis]GGE24047.1 transcriptional regulator [Streptococcus himalayensis]